VADSMMTSHHQNAALRQKQLLMTHSRISWSLRTQQRCAEGGGARGRLSPDANQCYSHSKNNFCFTDCNVRQCNFTPQHSRVHCYALNASLR